jgi:hypothetical protein
MNRYAFDTPLLNPKVYVPGVSEVPFAPATWPKQPAETDQTHRNMNWLFHKPQNHAVFPIQSESGRLRGKNK